MCVYTLTNVIQLFSRHTEELHVFNSMSLSNNVGFVDIWNSFPYILIIQMNYSVHAHIYTYTQRLHEALCAIVRGIVYTQIYIHIYTTFTWSTVWHSAWYSVQAHIYISTQRLHEALCDIVRGIVYKHIYIHIYTTFTRSSVCHSAWQLIQ